MRDLGACHIGPVRRIGTLACAVLAAGAVGGSAAPAAVGAASARPATYGPTRAWGGTKIRSLDPVRPRGATSGSVGHATRPATGRGRHDKVIAIGPDQVLSNETMVTRWAYVDHIVTIYGAPRTSSPRAGRLTWYTADGFPSVYLLLRAHWDARGREWVKLRVPGRPNGRTGWVRRGALGRFHLTHRLVVVNRERRRMYFYFGGRRIWSAPVGVGKRGTPTPTGHFWINERFNISDPRSGYYPYAFGTTDYSTLTDWPGGGVVGIHGPYFDPEGIPGNISHGCIRLKVDADRWLAAHVRLGTPLRVI